jgi:hypothetical protein
MSLNQDFKEFLECLTAESVEYLLVGGHALAFHGLPRFTKDIDFWVRPTPENARRILRALDAFGFAGLGLKLEDFTCEGKVVQLGLPPRRIDIVTSIDGVDFASAYGRRIESTYHGQALLVIHRDDLLRNKRSTGRPQDALDADELEKLPTS